MPETDEDLARRARQLETLERLSQRFGDGLSRAFARNVAEGRRLDGVLGQLSRTLLNAGVKAAVKPLRSGLESLFKGLFSGESLFARGGVIQGGLAVPFAKGGVVAAPTYFPLGRQLGVMGEAGPEAIMPLARGPDGRLGVAAGGGAGPSISVVIQAQDLESFRRSEAQVSAALARAVARGRRGL